LNPTLTPFETGLACGVVLGGSIVLCLVVVAIGLLLEFRQARAARGDE
jgi:hypothetical protein